MFTRLLRKRTRTLLFDFDDAIFLKSDGSVSRTRLQRFKAITRAADLIVAGNGYLAQRAHEANRAEVIPTSVNLDRYRGLSDRTDAPIDLVWIGSSSTSKYLDQHREVLEQLGQSVSNLRLKVIADFQLRLDHLEVVNVPWNNESEIHELSSSHVGIAPMIDDSWTRGKCALKVIQYMAAGLPVVSSNVGANREVVSNGVTGYLAESKDEWTQAVSELVASPSLRHEMGAAGRKLVEEKYSIEASVERLLSHVDQLTTL